MDFEQTLMLGHKLLACTKWTKLTHMYYVLMSDVSQL